MNWWVLKRRIHISWLITYLCFSIFVGVFLARYVDHLSVLPLLVAVIVIPYVIIRKYTYLIPFLVVSGIMFGLWRGSITQNELVGYKSLYEKPVLVMGSVKDDVDIGSSNQSVIRLNSLIINNKPMTGVLYVTSTTADIKRGDRLQLHGILKEGFGNFSGIIYRAVIDKVIHPEPGDVARVIRDWFADAIRKVIPEPESSLGIGYLVGQRRSLPADLTESLKTAGLTHIVVASGYNLTILVRLARRLFVKVSKYTAALAGVVMIIMFMSVAGVSPSMSRAGLVTALSLAAWYYGRRFHPITLLAIAIAITVMINPSYAWGDLGWQLSFAAFAGVMIIAPLSQRYFFGGEKPGLVGQILGETVSAQIATAPILIMAFGQISNVAIISNLLVLPFVPMAMLMTFMAGLSSIILPIFATFLAMPARWLLRYSISVAENLSNLPWATSNINFTWRWVVLCYLIITGICFYMWRATKYNLREINLVE